MGVPPGSRCGGREQDQLYEHATGKNTMLGCCTFGFAHHDASGLHATTSGTNEDDRLAHGAHHRTSIAEIQAEKLIGKRDRE
jgi:hypothetical protein